ncbi:MAG: class II aldolase/adducin family protein [Woeseiaceae bacterium]|nr:class II aldolase/adducin family protein [Woeseiaceae bacterium]
MSIDEGYIKFESHWTPGPAADPELTALLDRWRQPLFDAGLIGHYDELGVGYGNLSVRARDSGFVISGTQTGHIRNTGGPHYALVTDYDIAANQVFSTGPVEASSESLTHAAIYELDATISAVVHVHSASLWAKHLGRLPTTADDISYGTPEMARELERLLRNTAFATSGVAVMAGHEEGVIAYGRSLEEAAGRILALQSER